MNIVPFVGNILKKFSHQEFDISIDKGVKGYVLHKKHIMINVDIDDNEMRSLVQEVLEKHVIESSKMAFLSLKLKLGCFLMFLISASVLYDEAGGVSFMLKAFALIMISVFMDYTNDLLENKKEELVEEKMNKLGANDWTIDSLSLEFNNDLINYKVSNN